MAADCGLPPGNAPLPPVEAVVDTALLNTLFTRDSIVDGIMVLRVALDTAGEVASFGVIQTSLSEARAQTVALAVANDLRPQPPGGARWFRLGIGLATPRKYLLAPSEYCHARQRLGGGSMLGTERVEPGMRMVSVPAKWEVRITERGTVAGVRLLTSTGYSSLEQRARMGVERTTFEPATIDGRPTAVIDTIIREVAGVAR